MSGSNGSSGKPSGDIRPFMPIVSTPTRTLGSALPAVETPEVTSPWLPRPAVAAPAVEAPAGPPPPTQAEIDAIYDDARARGRADGLAETAALRDKLVAATAELAAARAKITAVPADLVTEIASCVLEAWTELAEPGALFAPVIRRWVEQARDQPAIVRVHPDAVLAMTEVVAGTTKDAPLTIVGDPALAPGAIEIRSPSLELIHDWRARLPELRTAIEGALTGGEA